MTTNVPSSFSSCKYGSKSISADIVFKIRSNDLYIGLRAVISLVTTKSSAPIAFASDSLLGECGNTVV